MNSEHQENSGTLPLHDLRISPEGLSALVKASPHGIIAIDPDGIIRFWNKAAEAITGWRENEVFGRSVEMLSKGQEEVYEEVRQRTLQREVLTALPRHGPAMGVPYAHNGRQLPLKLNVQRLNDCDSTL